MVIVFWILRLFLLYGLFHVFFNATDIVTLGLIFIANVSVWIISTKDLE